MSWTDAILQAIVPATAATIYIALVVYQVTPKKDQEDEDNE